jgi:sigma-B regulation protein RsbU (phosphoserine phosphatase)
MESELSIAREIQLSMLPTDFTLSPGRDDLEIHASLTPAKAVGGDFYDFLVRDGRLFFCIGDVSGKGVPSALVMSIISTQFRSLSSTEDKPEKIVSVINASSKDRNATMMFATLFVGILDPDTGVLSYCNAGHNAPVLIGKERCFLKVESNLPVGVETEWKYKGQQLTLAPGKTLLLYTDGLTEAENGNHDQFGERRILDVLEKSGAADPETLVRELADAVHAFTEPAEQSDDLTMLAIRYLGKKS